MVWYWMDDGSAVSEPEFIANLRANLKYLAPDDPAHAEQLKILRDVLEDMNRSKDVDRLIVKPVPARLKARCKWYMHNRFVGIYDAFKEAVREYPQPSKALQAAFMNDDYRDYIPSAYCPEYL